jgi:hypothetical protein
MMRRRTEVCYDITIHRFYSIVIFKANITNERTKKKLPNDDNDKKNVDKLKLIALQKTKTY